MEMWRGGVSWHHGAGLYICFCSELTELNFHDDDDDDCSSETNSEVSNILSANLNRNALNCTGRNFRMQQDNDPKHTVSKIKDFIGKGGGGGWWWKVLDLSSQSPDHFLKNRRKGEFHQKQTIIIIE